LLKVDCVIENVHFLPDADPRRSDGKRSVARSATSPPWGARRGMRSSPSLRRARLRCGRIEGLYAGCAGRAAIRCRHRGRRDFAIARRPLFECRAHRRSRPRALHPSQRRKSR
jgi:hypothetical protein